MEVNSQLIDKTIRTLGNFIWLGNNVQNICTPELRQMFVNAVNQPREVYDELQNVE